MPTSIDLDGYGLPSSHVAAIQDIINAVAPGAAGVAEVESGTGIVISGPSNNPVISTQLKTINGETIEGTGNITIEGGEGGGGITDITFTQEVPLDDPNGYEMGAVDWDGDLEFVEASDPPGQTNGCTTCTLVVTETSGDLTFTGITRSGVVPDNTLVGANYELIFWKRPNYTLCEVKLSYVAAPVFTAEDAPDGTLDGAYDYAFVATSINATGAYSVASGALPTGTTLNADTGHVSGTTSAEDDFTFVIAAEGPGGTTNSASQSVHIGPTVIFSDTVTRTGAVAGNGWTQGGGDISTDGSQMVLTGFTGPTYIWRDIGETEYIYSADAYITSGGDGGGIRFRDAGDNLNYCRAINAGGNFLVSEFVAGANNGANHIFEVGAPTGSNNNWKISVTDTGYSFYLDDVLIGAPASSTVNASNTGVGAQGGSDSGTGFDNFLVMPQP